MAKNKDRITVLKKVIIHRHSKEQDKRALFDKYNTLNFEKDKLYRRDQSPHKSQSQKLTNLLEY